MIVNVSFPFRPPARRVIVDVEDAEVLPEPVAVEAAVRVLEDELTFPCFNCETVVLARRQAPDRRWRCTRRSTRARLRQLGDRALSPSPGRFRNRSTQSRSTPKSATRIPITIRSREHHTARRSTAAQAILPPPPETHPTHPRGHSPPDRTLPTETLVLYGSIPIDTHHSSTRRTVTYRAPVPL